MGIDFDEPATSGPAASDDSGAFDPTTFAQAFRSFMESYAQFVDPGGAELRERLTRHLGCEADELTELPTVTERLQMPELPNVHLAMLALAGDRGSDAAIGLPFELTYRDDFSLASYVAGRYRGFSVDICPPEYVSLPISADDHLPCVQIGLWLIEIDGRPVVVLVRMGGRRRSGLNVEVAATDREAAASALRRIAELRNEHNVYRGKLLSLSWGQRGVPEITFHRVPEVKREDLILPDADLDALERHTVGIERRADALRAIGRHLKRGLLLYGPPGTGKTYSLMYLCNLMPNRTTIIVGITDQHMVGAAVALARQLAPAAIILEDVDLMAPERGMYEGGPPPLLFQMLNEMDGLAEDVDIIFGLTTNRVDSLEPALADRPGRIDQAIEYKLPDPQHRRRLLERYLQGVDGDPGDLQPIVSRTHGVSAAFIKELVRRASIMSTEVDGGDELGEVLLRPGDLERALADMSEHGSPVLRSLLGATTGPKPSESAGYG